jgi:hypothetical protein
MRIVLVVAALAAGGTVASAQLIGTASPSPDLHVAGSIPTTPHVQQSYVKPHNAAPARYQAKPSSLPSDKLGMQSHNPDNGTVGTSAPR